MSGEPRTAAGRALAEGLEDCECGHPTATRRIAIIEAEAAARSPYEDPLGRVTFGPGCGPFNHPVGCRCPVPLTFEAEAAATPALDVDVLDAAVRFGLIEVIPERRGISVGYFDDEHLRRLTEAVAAEYARLTEAER